MAETPLLQFVSYDPSGAGNPFLLALTENDAALGRQRWASPFAPVVRACS